MITKKTAKCGLCNVLSGAPDRTRTCGLLIRSQALYPAELRAHIKDYGARNQNRTDDLILTMDALYLLSYEGLSLERVKGIEPSLPAWEADVLPLNYTRTNL